jgi:hypothetical protein
MRIKINIRAGKLAINHNQQIARDGSKRRGIKVRTNMKAGRVTYNHNQTIAGGMRIKSNTTRGSGRADPAV